MATSIRLALTAEERELLYSFRYRIYVAEMNRPQKYADHARRRIEDPLDATGCNLVAWQGQAVVGCLRVNFAWQGQLDYYRDLLRMDELVSGYPEGVSLSTRLMVDPTWRGGNLAVRLSTEAYRLAKQNGVDWNFIDCNDHLVGYFQKLGYVFTHRAVHEEYGTVNAMLLDLKNWSLENGTRGRRSVPATDEEVSLSAS
jgi:GNAT superfamily N-acetyltransferase